MWHLQETYFKPESIGKLKVKVWKKIYYENFNKKEAGIAILISDKTDFRAKRITRQKGILYNDKMVNTQKRHSSPTW